jgi:hypothetical protein
MKKMILALVALSAVVFLAGCDPFGSTETMTYIKGTIYADTAMTVPAEGITVELLVNPDSSAVRAQTVFTNAAGVFFIEAQFYPSLPDEEAGTGYSMPATVTVGLMAHHGAKTYSYAGADGGFVLASGDTLVVWPVDLSSFGAESGGEAR